jgi:acyl-coenzyme A thioesterase PaaI-like protein
MSRAGGAETAVTAEMTVRFLRPVPTGSRLRAEARVTEARGRIIRTEARLAADDGLAAAEAQARFVAGKREP